MYFLDRENRQYLSDQIEMFYRRAKQHGYGKTNDPRSTQQMMLDGRVEITYDEGEWVYRDTYVDGEPFTGYSEILYQGKVVYSLLYAGEVFAGVDQEAVLSCLKEALFAPSAINEWRGPSFYESQNGTMAYLCRRRALEMSASDPNAFLLHEAILDRQTGLKLYDATFSGMMVNQR